MTQHINGTSWENLQRSTQDYLARAVRLRSEIESIHLRVQKATIYRPLKTFQELRNLSSELNKFKAEFRGIIGGLGQIISAVPSSNMGEILASCLDTTRLSTEMMRLQMEWSEVESAAQQTGAFAFAVFALYVSLLSLLATLILGIWSLLK
jgi:hypothetical protein